MDSEGEEGQEGPGSMRSPPKWSLRDKPPEIDGLGDGHAASDDQAEADEEDEVQDVAQAIGPRRAAMEKTQRDRRYPPRVEDDMDEEEDADAQASPFVQGQPGRPGLHQDQKAKGERRIERDLDCVDSPQLSTSETLQRHAMEDTTTRRSRG